MSEFKEFKVGDKAVYTHPRYVDVILTVEEVSPKKGYPRKINNGYFGNIKVSRFDVRHLTPEEIAAGHRIDNDMGDDSHIGNHISPLCKSKDV